MAHALAADTGSPFEAWAVLAASQARASMGTVMWAYDDLVNRTV